MNKIHYMSDTYKEYILEKLVRIVNVYSENYLKDHVLLTIMSLVSKVLCNLNLI